MDVVNLIIAFNLGLFSTLHCLGMCGGIVGALSMGIQTGTGATVHRAGFVLAYNLGRILSYTVAGSIAGLAGAHFITSIMPDTGHRVLQFIAAVVLILIGMHLAGWLPRFSSIEFAGYKLWRYIQPAGRYFLPVDKTYKALMIGMIWGWLPCALVYSVLLWSLNSGSAMGGALLMLAFGLGTLPGMFTAGVMGRKLVDILKHRQIRIWAGIVVILFGLVSPFLLTSHSGHLHGSQQNHMHH